jgi:hypothetical protein
VAPTADERTEVQIHYYDRCCQTAQIEPNPLPPRPFTPSTPAEPAPAEICNPLSRARCSI